MSINKLKNMNLTMELICFKCKHQKNFRTFLPLLLYFFFWKKFREEQLKRKGKRS